MGKSNATVYCSNKFSETVKNWIRFGDLSLTNRNTIWPLTISRKNSLRALIKMLNDLGESQLNKNSSNRFDFIMALLQFDRIFIFWFFWTANCICSNCRDLLFYYLPTLVSCFSLVEWKFFNPVRLVRSNTGFGAFSFLSESMVSLRS